MRRRPFRFCAFVFTSSLPAHRAQTGRAWFKVGMPVCGGTKLAFNNGFLNNGIRAIAPDRACTLLFLREVSVAIQQNAIFRLRKPNRCKQWEMAVQCFVLRAREKLPFHINDLQGGLRFFCWVAQPLLYEVRAEQTVLDTSTH